MNFLEQIRKEAQALPKIEMIIRDGSTRKGHWRHYANHSVWVEPMEISAHYMVAKRRNR